MIVKSNFRGAGGLAAHLSRVDQNERVIVREDLSTGCVGSIKDAIANFAAMARATGSERPLVHIVVSPGADVPADGEATIIETVRTQYEVEDDHPLLVVAHDKKGDTGREQHFHIVLPAKNPFTGKAISDSWNFRTNEKIARILEVEFDHPLVSGKFNQSIAKELASSHSSLSKALSELDLPSKNGVIGTETTQQAERLKLNQKSFDECVWNAWQSSRADFKTFALKLDASGISVARGDRAMLVVDDATGYSSPMVRLLRRKAKLAGASLSLREADFSDAFANAKDFKSTRDEGLTRARDRAEHEVEREYAKGIMESLADADYDAAQDFQAEHNKLRNDNHFAAIAANEKTLKQRREEIWALYRERNRLRRLRVERAFRAARIARNRHYEEIAFVLAAGTALLTGMSLGMALGFVVWVALATKIARYDARHHESPKEAVESVNKERVADLVKAREETRITLSTRSNTKRRKQSQRPSSGIER